MMRKGKTVNKKNSNVAIGASAVLVTSMLMLVAGCGPKRATEPLQPAAPGGEYVIGPGDVLQIRVWENDELSVSVPVRPDGKVSVPLLDDVDAAGKTALELKDTLTEGFKTYVRAPDVTVIVTQINSKRVSIVGQVANPTSVALQGDMRVVDIIAMVGGFTPFADRSDIRVLRPAGATISEHRFDYDAYLKGVNPEGNILLAPGDTIVVAE